MTSYSAAHSIKYANGYYQSNKRTTTKHCSFKFYSTDQYKTLLLLHQLINSWRVPHLLVLLPRRFCTRHHFFLSRSAECAGAELSMGKMRSNSALLLRILPVGNSAHSALRILPITVHITYDWHNFYVVITEEFPGVQSECWNPEMPKRWNRNQFRNAESGSPYCHVWNTVGGVQTKSSSGNKNN